MKKKYFEQLQIGDIVFFKNRKSITSSKNWVGNGVICDAGSRKSMFLPYLGKQGKKGMSVYRVCSIENTAYVETSVYGLCCSVPRQVLKNSTIRNGKEIILNEMEK